MLMAKASSLLHYLAKSSDDPGEYLALVNGEICESGTGGIFISIVSGFVNAETGIVRLVNAGHHPPLYQNEDGSYEQVPARAPALGISRDAEFPAETISLNSGGLSIFTGGGPPGQNKQLETEEMARLIQSKPKLNNSRQMQGATAEIRHYHDGEHGYMSLVLRVDGSE